MTSVNNQESVS